MHDRVKRGPILKAQATPPLYSICNVPVKPNSRSGHETCHGVPYTHSMLRRGRVRPEIDPYIRLRYEDTAVWIHYDLKAGRGMHSYYAPWLESMIQTLSPESRQKYSLMGAVKLPSLPVATQTQLTENQAQENSAQIVEAQQHQSKFCVIL